MKVFVSWSGQRSKAVAEMFSDWLKCVIQASQPWTSTRDIDRGAIWFSEINDKLKDVSVGVICLTQENKGKPWILFETGALAKGLSTNRVCTFLIDLSPEDLQDPLAQFNHTTPNISSMWELVRTINSCLNEKALDERILKQVFDTYWPQFNSSFQDALEKNPPNEIIPPRSEQDILTEILNNTRSLASRVRNLESKAHGYVRENYKSLFLKTNELNAIRDEIKKAIDVGLNDEDALLSIYGRQDAQNVVIKEIIKELLNSSEITLTNSKNG